MQNYLLGLYMMSSYSFLHSLYTTKNLAAHPNQDKKTVALALQKMKTILRIMLKCISAFSQEKGLKILGIHILHIQNLSYLV